MLKILIFIAFVALVGYVLMWAANHFSSENKAVRASRRSDEGALTAERQRSNIAQRALREIAAGAEYPIFVAGNALESIENTYTTKEIR